MASNGVPPCAWSSEEKWEGPCTDSAPQLCPAPLQEEEAVPSASETPFPPLENGDKSSQ